MEIKIGSLNIASGRISDTKTINQSLISNQLDVIGIQEVDMFTNRSNKTNMVSNLAGNMYQSFFAPAMNYDGGEYGIALLSNEELLNTEYVEFVSHGDEKRIFQIGKIKIGNKILTICNTHLSFENSLIRKEQVNQLLAYLNTQEYVVLTGDFNFDQSVSEWSLLKDYFYLANGFNGKWINTFIDIDDNMRNFAIDNIAISKNMKFKNIEVANKVISDHKLLMATVII